MGLRGPIRQVDSRRGVSENAAARLEPPESLSCPKWLCKSGREIFDELAADLFAAKVPLKRADTHSLAMAAYCIDSVQEWAKNEQKSESVETKLECAKMVARFQRDAQSWVDKICATPQSRARIGLKSEEKRKVGTVFGITQRKAVLAAERKQGSMAV